MNNPLTDRGEVALVEQQMPISREVDRAIRSAFMASTEIVEILPLATAIRSPNR